MIINEIDIEKTKRKIRESKEIILIESKDNNYNRKILEYGKFNALLDTEVNGKISLKNIDSGFNQVLGRIAEENKIALGINLEGLRSADNKEKAERLSKIMQNIRISRKTGNKIKLINRRDKINAMLLMQDLGSSTKQAKGSISF